MDSAIHLCHSPLPTAPLRLSSCPVGAARASRVHLSISHGSLCLSHTSTRHPVARPLHVNCILDRFSERSKNEENDNKILRGMTGVSLVLALVLGAFSFSSKMNPKFNAAYAWQWSHGPTTTTGFPGGGAGEIALKSFLNMINADAIPSKQTRPYLSYRPDKEEIEALKLYAVGLTKSGNPNEALRTLEKECERFKGLADSERYLKTAVIELLIFQGKHKEASRRLDDLIDELISSVTDLEPNKLSYGEKCDLLCNEDEYPFQLSKDVFLYKAIVHTMLEEYEEAAKWGKALKSTLP